MPSEPWPADGISRSSLQEGQKQSKSLSSSRDPRNSYYKRFIQAFKDAEKACRGEQRAQTFA